MAEPAYKIIRNGLVVDPAKRKTGIQDILIKGDVIEDIGPPGLAAPEGGHEIAAENFIIIPGLINAHTHTHGSLGKGLGDCWSLELLLNANPWVSGNFLAEDKRLSAQLNAAEMVLKGCTAAYDMFFELPLPSAEGMAAVGEAYRELGVRMVLAPMMGDILFFRAIPGLLDALPEDAAKAFEKITPANAQDLLKACENIYKDWRFSSDDVKPAIGPTIPLHCSDDFVMGCRDMAREYDLRTQMHLAEAKFQVISGLKKYGKSLTAHIDELGLITETFTGAHGVWLDDDDIKRLADKGASVAHNPGANLRLGSGVAPAFAMRAGGLNVGIGTDGSACSDSQNMFEAMRQASFVAHIADPNPDHWLTNWDILEMATIGSAKVLGFGGAIGRIAPGYKADLVFLDKTHINYTPLNDAANQIVNCEDSSAVDSVMIGGRMVLEGGKFTGFDFATLRSKVQAAADGIRERNAGLKAKSQVLDDYVAQHCIGLASEDYHVRRRLEG